MPSPPVGRDPASHVTAQGWWLSSNCSLSSSEQRRKTIRRWETRVQQTRRGPHLPGAGRSGLEFLAGMPPLWFFVHRATCDLAKVADDRAVQTRCRRGNLTARGVVHERHELVREAWHRASDADTADVRAATDAVDPSSLGNVALDDRAPTALFFNASPTT